MRIQKFLDDSPLFSLYVAFDRVLRHFQNRLQKEDVHFVQALILTGLFFEEKPVRPADLARTLEASRSNISHALRDLERKSLVERSLVKEDARAYAISLTRNGRRQATRLIRIFDKTQERFEAAGASINLPLRQFIKIYEEDGGV